MNAIATICGIVGGAVATGGGWVLFLVFVALADDKTVILIPLALLGASIWGIRCALPSRLERKPGLAGVSMLIAATGWSVVTAAASTEDIPRVFPVYTAVAALLFGVGDVAALVVWVRDSRG